MTEAFNIDCMDAMAEMKDNEFDLAIVDPPYGIGMDISMAANNGKFGYKKRKASNWDQNTPNIEYFNQLKRVSLNQIIWGGNYFNLGPSRCYLIWDKVQRINQADAEMAWSSFNTSTRIFQYARGNESGFAPMLKEKNWVNIHPTQKPIALYKWLLKNYAKEGDRILDTHLGSGSSRMAAHDMGFDFVGYEIDKDYFDAQEKRFTNHIKQQSLFKPNDMY